MEPIQNQQPQNPIEPNSKLKHLKTNGLKEDFPKVQKYEYTQNPREQLKFIFPSMRRDVN